MGSTGYFVIVIALLAVLVLRYIFLDEQKKESPQETDVAKVFKNMQSNITQKIKMNQTSRLSQKNFDVDTKTNLRVIHEDIDQFPLEGDNIHSEIFNDGMRNNQFTNDNVIGDKNHMMAPDTENENKKTQENKTQYMNSLNFDSPQGNRSTDEILSRDTNDNSRERKNKRSLTTRRFDRNEVLERAKKFTAKIQQGMEEKDVSKKDITDQSPAISENYETIEIKNKIQDYDGQNVKDENLIALEEDSKIVSSFIKKIESITIPYSVNYKVTHYNNEEVLSPSVVLRKSSPGNSNENRRVTTMLEMFEKNYD